MFSSNPRSPRRTTATKKAIVEAAKAVGVPILDRPEGRPQPCLPCMSSNAALFQSSIAPKDDRNREVLLYYSMAGSNP